MTDARHPEQTKRHPEQTKRHPEQTKRHPELDSGSNLIIVQNIQLGIFQFFIYFNNSSELL